MKNKARPERCKWTVDADPDYGDKWDTECGEAFQFNDGGPKENRMVFCPYCGARIHVRVYA